MWKCPRCETLNDQEKCIICGEPMPKEAEAPKAEPEKVVVATSKSNEKVSAKKPVEQTSRHPVTQATANTQSGKKEKPAKKEKVKKEKVEKEKPAKEKKGGKGKVVAIILVVLALIAVAAAGAVVFLGTGLEESETDVVISNEVIEMDETLEEETFVEEVLEEETEAETEKPTEKPAKKTPQSQSPAKKSSCTYCGSTSHTSSQHPSCSVCGSKYHGASYHNAGQEYCATCQKYTDHSTYEHPAPGI